MTNAISMTSQPHDPASASPLDMPLVIVGPLRSGTTLLRLLCDHHPRVSIFGEFEEAVAMLPEQGWIPVGEYVRRLPWYRAFCSSGASLPTSAGDYPEAVQTIFAERVAGVDADTVGFCVHSRPDRLPDIWPDAKYIHLRRDPRDVARSCIGMGWVGTVFHGVKYWRESEQRIEQMRERVAPESVLTVRFEDLVRRPEAELARICEFLGHEYDPAMLAIDGDTTYSRPDARLAEQWRHKLTPREIELVEWRCGEAMTACGYERRFPEPRGPRAIEMALLRARNRWNRSRFRVQRYGLGLTVGWAAAKRIPGGSPVRRRLKRSIDAIDTANLK